MNGSAELQQNFKIIDTRTWVYKLGFCKLALKDLQVNNALLPLWVGTFLWNFCVPEFLSPFYGVGDRYALCTLISHGINCGINLKF